MKHFCQLKNGLNILKCWKTMHKFILVYKRVTIKTFKHFKILTINWMHIVYVRMIRIAFEQCSLTGRRSQRGINIFMLLVLTIFVMAKYLRWYSLISAVLHLCICLKVKYLAPVIHLWDSEKCIQSLNRQLTWQIYTFPHQCMCTACTSFPYHISSVIPPPTHTHNVWL